MDNKDKILDNLKKLNKNFELTKKYEAIVEDNEDPEDIGRVRIRVSDVHPTSKIEMPTNQLPWSKVNSEIGSGGGMGKNNNLLVGQWVIAVPATPSASSWIVVANIPTKPSNDTGDGAYGNVAQGDDNKTQNEIIPKLSTGDITKLAGTAFSLGSAALLKYTTGEGGAGDSTPEVPDGPFIIVVEEVDWTLKEINKFGGNLGHFDDFIKIDGLPPKSTAKIELISEGANNSPGNIVGYDTDGEKTYVTYINKNLYIPAYVVPGSYSIQYKVSEIDIPLNAEIQYILIEVIDEPLPKTITRGTISARGGQTNDIELDIAELEISEPAPTSDKAKSKSVRVDQGIENSVTIENDATPGNRRYSITHMADEDNPESISRIEMNPSGALIQKSADDMYIISKKNLLQYVENAVEQTIKGYLSINAPTILLKGNIRIEGDMNINGDITHNGNKDHYGHTTQEGSQTSTQEIHSDTEVSAKTIGLTTHKHTEVGGTDNGLSTSVPTP